VKIYKVYYESTVGVAYVKATSLGAAINKIMDTTPGDDTDELKCEFWDPEPGETFPNLESVVEITGSKAAKAMFAGKKKGA